MRASYPSSGTLLIVACACLGDQIEINRAIHMQASGSSGRASCKCQPCSQGLQRGAHVRTRRISVPPAVSKPGKRGGVVHVKQEASLTTQREERGCVWVPRHKEPTLGDISRHVDDSYALTRREGVLPEKRVVIPDTQTMYNKADNTDVFELYEVDGLRVKETSIDRKSVV